MGRGRFWYAKLNQGFLIIAGVVLVTTNSVSAFTATTSDIPDPTDQTKQTQTDVFGQGVNYFDLNPATAAACGSGGVALSGKDNAEKAYNYFLSQGLTAPVAAGIVGNLKLESGVDPNSSQVLKHATAEEMIAKGLLNPGYADGWGIAQWDPPDKIITPLKKDGKDPNDLGVQLQFLWDGLDKEYAVVWKDILARADGGDPNLSAAAALKKAKTPTDAADIFFAAYERPLDTSSLAGRESAAEDYYKTQGGGSGGGSSTGGCGGVNGPTAGKNLLVLPAGATGRNVYYVNQFSDLNQYRSQVNPNYDFWTCGCGPTSALMIQMSFANNGDYTVDTLNTLLHGLKGTPGAFDGGGFCATSNPGLMNYFKSSLGYTTAVVDGNDSKGSITDAVVAKMKAMLGDGYLLMVDVRTSYAYTSSQSTEGHHTVIYGYDATGFYVANPGWKDDTFDSKGKPYPIPADKIQAIGQTVWAFKKG